MNKSVKYYKKALKFYYDGNIDKALNYCNKSISFNIKNSAALSLKGLLLYFKGELKEARNIWERNYKINGDEVAKKYLVDSRADFEKMDIYDEAILKMQEMKISLAIKLLLHCKKSDFNCLNVNKKLIECYLKKGEYDKITDLVSEFKIIDKKDVQVKNVEKELIKIGVKEKESNKEVIFKIAGGVVVTILIVGAIKYFVNFVKNTPIDTKDTVVMGNKGQEENRIDKEEKEYNNKVAEEEDKTNNQEDKTNSEEVNTTDDQEVDKTNNEEATTTEDQNKYASFPKDELEESLEQKNVDSLISILKKIDENTLSINDRMSYNKAQKYVEKNAVGYYLEKGNSFVADENYEKAIQEYEKGMKYFKKGVSYGEDIVFELASINLQLEIVEETIKYCDMLHENYSDSGYHEDTMYQAAMFMKSRDMEKAKEYALKLKEVHPNSEYINSYIKEILSQ
ncbi:tetratricopeptide repeat protein [Oceanirhabdus sp. W0125-5]|uniref:tetratricopeptide repeat protein n=1 Tax=Oceanirhabdus sp. W0125-5 TaxID=2999116 RepID=UPI0022F2F818|nr:hypothetical protein [Oceanirhabdus sp. W0125-5]WBW98047.1 hypothetical protein OW730_04595 [Oceanirhabdus sp. W0125-5]